MQALIIAALVGLACAQVHQRVEANPAPIPYKYAYTVTGDEGSHSAEETSDGNGSVQGSYTIQLADGRTRTVTYVADQYGFRPSISTNEQGTESKAPADTALLSSALTGEEAALKFGPQYEVRRTQQPFRA